MKDDFEDFDECFDAEVPSKEKANLDVTRAKDMARGVWTAEYLKKRNIEKRKQVLKVKGIKFIEKCFYELSKFKNEKFCFTHMTDGGGRKLRLIHTSESLQVVFYRKWWSGGDHVVWEISFNTTNRTDPYKFGAIGSSKNIKEMQMRYFKTEEDTFNAIETLLAKYLEI